MLTNAIKRPLPYDQAIIKKIYKMLTDVLKRLKACVDAQLLWYMSGQGQVWGYGWYLV